MNLFEGPTEQASQLAQRVREGHGPVTLSGDPGKTWLLQETARFLGSDAVVVQVPRDLDRTAYVLLSAAAQCGAETLERTASRLAAHQADPAAALDVLAAALGHRLLLVDDLDALEGSVEDGELRDVFAPSVDRVRAWLLSKASLVSRRADASDDVKPLLREPRADERWSSELLWKHVGQDVDLYTLAVARTLLLGVSVHEPQLRWDAASLVSDLWRGMTHEVRELVALLAVHGRPLNRMELEGLGLVPDAAIHVGLESHLVEEARGLLRLTAASSWLRVLSLSDRRERHRRLADAFARVAREAGSFDAAPLSVLEAHRHYAAVPDIDRAREFARFGVALLLATAKQLSIDGRYTSPSYDRSSRTYDLVLKLDEQVRAAGDVGGIGRRARAYAIHYRAYNRYKAHSDKPQETLSAYREALTLWSENALFWSRTIGCCFVAESYEEGMRARDDALAAVPEHPQRTAVVIARTVEHLLRRDLVLAALLVWSDHQARTLVEREVVGRLLARIAMGWEARRLLSRGVAPLAFRVAVSVRIAAEDPMFACHLIGLVYRGSSPEAALGAALRDLFVELESLVEDPDLSAERAIRKRQLVSLLDLDELRAGDEAARWAAYLASLDDLTARGLLTEAQHRSLLSTWRRARQAIPRLRRPAVGRTEDGRVYLSWSFGDRPGVTFTVDFEPDGCVDWFYRHAADDLVLGTEDEPEPELPAEAFVLLAPFAS